MPVSARTAALVLACVLLASGGALAARRVLVHERAELEHETPPRTLAELASAPGSTRVSARLTEVELQAGERAVFELCSSDPLAASRWLDAFDLAVFQLSPMALMLRVPLDAEHLAAARRNSRGACLPLGGGPIERTGRYSVDAVWPKQPPAAELQQVPLTLRVLALNPLSPLDRAAVGALGAGAALLIVAWLLPRRRRTPQSTDEAPARDANEAAHVPGRPMLLRELAFGALALAALVLVTRVPSEGSMLTFAKGVALVVLQVGTALLFVRLARPHAAGDAALALVPPAGRLPYWLGAALITAAALVASARLSLRLVPATAEAPIQTFVSWPSGLLCFAALGVLLPLGEELFFRGYLYRIALGLGRAAAFWLTFAVFLALHAEQSWVNWGGLVAIAVAGLALTGLRARSGSVLVPALAHVLYNFTLSMASF